MDNFNDKERLSQDAKLNANKDIYIKQLELIWGMMRHIAYISGATYIAWYLLINEKKYILAILTIILSTIIMFTLLMIVRRLLQLHLQYGHKIKSSLNGLHGAFKPEKNIDKLPFIDQISCRVLERIASAEMLARLIPSIVILSNHALIYITAAYWFCDSFYLALVTLVANFLLSLVFIYKFRYLAYQFTQA